MKEREHRTRELCSMLAMACNAVGYSAFMLHCEPDSTSRGLDILADLDRLEREVYELRKHLEQPHDGMPEHDSGG